MLWASIKLLSSVAWAAVKPEIYTNFLTEDDLNRAFVKLVGIVAIPVLLQLFLTIKESRSGLVKEVREMNAKLSELIPVVKNIKDDYVTHDKVKYLARLEAYDVMDRSKK